MLMPFVEYYVWFCLDSLKIEDRDSLPGSLTISYPSFLPNNSNKIWTIIEEIRNKI